MKFGQQICVDVGVPERMRVPHKRQPMLGRDTAAIAPLLHGRDRTPKESSYFCESAQRGDYFWDSNHNP
jgi:hypothetical protein